MLMLGVLGKEKVNHIDLYSYSFHHLIGFTTHDKFSFFATSSRSDFNYAKSSFQNISL